MIPPRSAVSPCVMPTAQLVLPPRHASCASSSVLRPRGCSSVCVLALCTADCTLGPASSSCLVLLHLSSVLVSACTSSSVLGPRGCSSACSCDGSVKFRGGCVRDGMASFWKCWTPCSAQFWILVMAVFWLKLRIELPL